MKQKTCENCHYYVDYSGVCMNYYSDFCADYVDECFSCKSYVEKEAPEETPIPTL